MPEFLSKCVPPGDKLRLGEEVRAGAEGGAAEGKAERMYGVSGLQPTGQGVSLPYVSRQ